MAHAPASRMPITLLPWLIVVLGAAVMFLPTGINLFRNIWSSESQGHGPIVLMIAVWLFWRKWPDMLKASEGDSPWMPGWMVFICGIFFYVVGRSQGIDMVEVGSFIWVLAGLLLLLRGRTALRALWFPLFFLVFLLPLPASIVDALTLPMKIAVSHVAEEVLFWFGYPIARSGVILQIGQYKLMVADACAGLQTLFTLEALGLLYLNLVRHPSAMRNIALAILIVPISFTANTIRVIVLTLVTYHLGDEAGQGFLHGFAGMVLFMSALLLIIGLDSVLRLGIRSRNTQIATGDAT